MESAPTLLASLLTLSFQDLATSSISSPTPRTVVASETSAPLRTRTEELVTAFSESVPPLALTSSISTFSSVSVETFLPIPTTGQSFSTLLRLHIRSLIPSHLSPTVVNADPSAVCPELQQPLANLELVSLRLATLATPFRMELVLKSIS